VKGKEFLIASMGISTYVRVNNFQFPAPDEVHFEQRTISPPSFAAVLLSLGGDLHSLGSRTATRRAAVACQP
jgi:hypothetical protein